MLKIDIKPIKGILFIRLSGRLNKTTIKKLNEVTKFIKKVGIKNIVFNITDLDYIDNDGINAIFKNYQICQKNNGQGFICISKKNESILNNYEKLNIINDELTAVKLINI